MLIRELCRTTWRDRLDGVARPGPVDDPADYLDLLAGLGCRVDAWETTYLHVLPGEDAVLRWVTGTALRPMLDRLTPDEAEAFLGDCAALLRRPTPAAPTARSSPSAGSSSSPRSDRSPGRVFRHFGDLESNRMGFLDG
ncbi:hypothetical protein ACFQX6_49475 [Streptosporangium lutulentum]